MTSAATQFTFRSLLTIRHWKNREVPAPRTERERSGFCRERRSASNKRRLEVRSCKDSAATWVALLTPRSSPSGPVYPAAFRRVLGVTGATSDRTSYARNSFWRLVRNPLAIAQWFSRGSFGPDGSWRTKLMHREKPDPSEVRKMGILRAYPIAGYSPNIPWLHAPTKKDQRNNLIDLNGAGTSAATPQVAAAAALWLQFHRPELERSNQGDKWRTWEKAEAVYTALLLSADRPAGHVWPDRYLGAGLLKANRALNVSFSPIKEGIAPFSTSS